MESVDGRVIKAVVKEVSEANKEFETAVSQNKWAGLLSEAAGDGAHASHVFQRESS